MMKTKKSNQLAGQTYNFRLCKHNMRSIYNISNIKLNSTRCQCDSLALALAHNSVNIYIPGPANGGHALFACGWSNQLSKHWHCPLRSVSFQSCHGIRKQTRMYAATACNNEPSEKCVLWAWRMSRHKVTHAQGTTISKMSHILCNILDLNPSTPAELLRCWVGVGSVYLLFK